MYLNQRMLTHPDSYRNADNSTLIDTAVSLYNQFCDNSWWPVNKAFKSIETFSNTHHIILKPNGAIIDKLTTEPQYRYAEIDGETFINSDGWWLPLKLFPGLTDDSGALLGDCQAYTLPASISKLPWIKDCCFKYVSGYIDFWFLEDSFPIKVLASRSMQEARLCRYFKDVHGVDVSVKHDCPFGNTLRCYAG